MCVCGSSYYQTTQHIKRIQNVLKEFFFSTIIHNILRKPVSNVLLLEPCPSYWSCAVNVIEKNSFYCLNISLFLVDQQINSQNKTAVDMLPCVLLLLLLESIKSKFNETNAIFVSSIYSCLNVNSRALCGFNLQSSYSLFDGYFSHRMLFHRVRKQEKRKSTRNKVFNVLATNTK